MRRFHADTMAFVLAGGEGTRLHPLTSFRCKPAVPFNGRYRIVDFVLSNMENSGIGPVHMLVQHKAESLIEHVRSRDQLARQRNSSHAQSLIIGPDKRSGGGVFKGTADAVIQNLHLIEKLKPEVVAIFSADHIYRMDVRQMIDEHIARRAEVTVATIPVPLAESRSFGIVETDDHLWVRQFREKPIHAQPMPGRSGCALASMGNYIFSTEVLVEELRRAAAAGETDFGNHVLPRLVASRRMLAYDYTTNYIPGLATFEDPSYWRDVGTIDAYFQAQQDTLGAEPRLRLANPDWPIHAGVPTSGPALVEDTVMSNSHVGARCVVKVAHVRSCMLRQNVRVGRHARLDHSLVMDHTSIGSGARITRAIIDQDNAVPPGETIGIDLDRDSQRFHVSAGGIVVVPQGHFRQADWERAAA